MDFITPLKFLLGLFGLTIVAGIGFATLCAIAMVLVRLFFKLVELLDNKE